MINQNFYEFSPEVGEILSPIIKFISVAMISVVIIAMYKKYKAKTSILARNLLIMFTLYFIAAIFSTFDILLGWKNINAPNSYLGINIAVIFTAGANVVYYWFLMDVFYDKKIPLQQKRKTLIQFGILDISTTIIGMFFRLFGSRWYIPFMIVHAILSIYLFTKISHYTRDLLNRLTDDADKSRIKNILWSSWFGLTTIILFSIDAFSDYVTIFSLIGWISLSFLTVYLYRGYI